jgi:hypothetical protein
MTSEERTQLDGTVIQGADGSLYFIPTEDLQAYRLPDDAASEEESGEEDVTGHLYASYQPLYAVQGPVAYQQRSPGLAFGPTLVPSKILNLGGFQR